MNPITERLAANPLFAPLGKAGIASVVECGSPVTFAANDTLFRVEDRADEFFLIEKGRVAIELDESRRSHLILSTVGPGELLGVSWILPPHRWTFDARALEPVDAVRFDATCLRAKCDADPALGYGLFKAVAGVVRDRLAAARLQLLDVYGAP